MIVTSYSIQTKATKSDIWPFYANLKAWTEWDEDIEYAWLEGNNFTQGTTGVIKPRGASKVKFKLSEVTKNQSFTNISYLPLTKMTFSHQLTDNLDETTTITHQIEMKGLTAPLFAFIIGRQMKAKLPDAMKKLAQLAESNPSEGSIQ
ncbi:MAG TPA: polyketide cyclase/dehydrase and lipid transport [Gammaproteobacteria bacterium]|nr:polyketide cyclase/dehydrase and lipid transport [Gammaproteobacteria bacterium]